MPEQYILQQLKTCVIKALDEAVRMCNDKFIAVVCNNVINSIEEQCNEYATILGATANDTK